MDSPDLLFLLGQIPVAGAVVGAIWLLNHQNNKHSERRDERYTLVLDRMAEQLSKQNEVLAILLERAER